MTIQKTLRVSSANLPRLRHHMAGRELVYEPDSPDKDTIKAAFKQLFGEEEKG